MPPTRLSGTACIAVAAVLAFSFVLSTPAGAVTPNGRLQIIQLDVGQGDGAVIISPLGQVAMIDNGVGGNPTPASGVKVPAQLQALGITHVDHHFASHYHSDHIGLFPTIFGGGGIATIGYGWDRGGSYSTSYYTNYVAALGSKRRTLVKDQVITLDSLSAHPVTIKCVNLAGAGLSTTDENSLSLVLKISYGEFDMLFGGDSPGSTGGGGVNVEGVVGPQAGPVEAFKVHHHGSRYSSNAAFLSAIQPKVGVISVGTGNSYGHPTSDALSRLHTAGVKTYWTETGSGVAPLAGWDYVSNNQIVISATWQPGGVDTVRGNGFAHTFTNSGSADVTAPAVAVTSPDGGEIWKAGSTRSVTWTATDAVGVTSVDLAYSTDGGATFPNAIATGIPNSGSWSWIVPNTPTGAARVRALARDAAGNAGRDSSAANFTIDRWTITASAGAGGSVSPSGTVPVVEGASQAFTITPASGYQVLDVLADAVSVGPVASHTFTNVTANHTLAATFSADAYALVVSTVGSGTATKSPDLTSYPYGASVTLAQAPAAGWAFASWSGDTSSTADTLALTVTRSRSLTATFVDVAAPVVTLTAPVGGDAWEVGTVQNITWTASDNAAVDSVDVDYAVTGAGGPWLAVARGLANTGSYAWTVPGPASDDVLVRVTAYDPAANAGSAQSEAPLRLVPTAGVTAGGAGRLALARPQPNPSRGTTLLRFSLPAAGPARLEVVDLTGRRLWQAEAECAAGPQAWRWDGRGSEGGDAGAGLYFVRLVTPWGTRTERLVRLR